MKRALTVILDDTVTDTHCGDCGYRVILHDEDPVCSQDDYILGIYCGLLLRDRMITESGRVHYLRTELVGDDGEYVNVNLYNYDTDTYDSAPNTLRLQECRDREHKV